MEQEIKEKIDREIGVFQRFLKPKKNKYQTKEQVKTFFKRYFSTFENYYYCLRNNKIITKFFNSNFLNPLRIVLYFPYNEIIISTTLEEANKINVISPFYNSDYQEKPIKFKYYDEEIKSVLNGPDLIISKLPIESVCYSNGEKEILLIEFLKEAK
jgi:hypothetical protein